MKNSLIKSVSVLLSLLFILTSLALSPVSAVEPDSGDKSGEMVTEGPDEGILGDVDWNGIVNIRDKVRIQQYIDDNTLFPNFYKKAADVNRDGVVNADDVTKLENYISGNDNDPYIGKPISSLGESASDGSASETEGELSNYYVTGSGGLCGEDWSTKPNPDTQMTLKPDGSYVKVFEKVFAGHYIFKVIDITDGIVTWHPAGADNYSSVMVTVSGSTVVITLDPMSNSGNDCATAEVIAPATSESSAPETEPTTPTQPTEGTEPTQPTEGTEPTQPTEASEGSASESSEVSDSERKFAYLSAASYTTGNEIWYAYTFGNDVSSKWVRIGDENKFEDLFDQVIFVRMNNMAGNNPSWSYVWNQTESLVVENGGTYTITGWGLNYLEGKWNETPAPHSHSYKITESIAPDCTHQGYTKYTCTQCGHTYNDGIVEALGHSYEVTDYRGATCTKDGYAAYRCSRCNDTCTETLAATGHDYSAESDEQNHTIYRCSHCGDSYSDDTYTVTWIVNGVSSSEQYTYKEMPSYKGGIIISTDDGQFTLITGWDKDIARVERDVTYTAIIDEKTEIGGNCGSNGGNNVRWALLTDGTLTVAGSGIMEYYSSSDKTPWNDVRDYIKKVEVIGNVLSVSDYAFAACKNLTDVYFGDSVESVGRRVCYNCPKLSSVRLPAALRSIFGSVTDTENVEYLHPDLTTTAVSVPSNGVSESKITVEWTVENTGNVTTSNISWRDKVYLMSSDTFDANQAISVLTVNNLSALDAGEHYTNSCEFSLPYGVSGQIYAYVVTDADSAVYEKRNEADNTCRSAACMVSLIPKSDLRASDLEAAVCYENSTGVFTDNLSTISKSDAIVRWKVTNGGEALPEDAVWTDAVYLVSSDGEQSVLLGRVSVSVNEKNSSVKMTDGEYTAECRVNIPEQYFGSYKISVISDCYGNISEYVKDNNKTEINADITLNPPADIVPKVISIPAEIVSGETVEIQWKDVNEGVMSVSSKIWTDKIYISDSSDYSSAKKSLLAQKYNVTENTLNSVTVTIPKKYSGTYFIFIVADEAHTVFEYETYSNNISVNAIDVELCKRPDLIVTDVSVENDSIYANESVTVTYRVKNTGEDSAKAFLQTDSFYIVSADGKRINLDSKSKTSAYGIDEELTFTAELSLPKNLAGGEYTLYVNVDNSNDLFEENEKNNTGSVSVVINESKYADLFVDNLEMNLDGSQATITYTVKNEGNLEASSWKDSVTIESGNNRYVLGVFDNKTALAPNSEYTNTVTVTIPDYINAGVYEFIIKADHNQNIDELNRNNNTVLGSSIESSYTYARGNTDLSTEIESVNNVVKSGEFVNATYVVTNLSEYNTKATSWSDEIRLINERGETIAKNSVVRRGVLKADEFYRETISVRVPDGLSGSFSVKIISDINNTNGETSFENNTACLSNAVSVELADYPDLTVMSVALPEHITAGQSFELSYIVKNNGAVSSSERKDIIKYKAAGATGFTTLKTISVKTAVEAGKTDEQKVTLTLPSNLEGDCVFLIETNSAKAFYEDYSNNSLTDSVEVLPSPSAELSAFNVVIPAEATPGKTITVKWDIINLSEKDLNAYFTDNIYISADNKWDSKDILVTQYNRGVNLKGASTTVDVIDITLPEYEQLSKLTEQTVDIVPGVKEGKYYIIVRADARNQIREENEENNICASSVPLTVNMEGIEFDETKSLSLAGSSDYYYCLNIPEAVSGAATLKINGLSEKAAVEVYIKYGEVPTAVFYDKKVTSLNAALDYIPFAISRKGKYYIYIREVGVVAENKLTVTVKEEPYGVHIVSPTLGGKGNVTVKLTGAMLEAGMKVYLQNETKITQATALYLIDSTTAYATFNTEYLPNGVYSVRAVSVYGESILENAFTVSDLPKGKLEVHVSIPSTIESGSTVSGTLTWTNSGYTDLYSPVLYLASSGITFKTPYSDSFTSEEMFFAYNSTGISGIQAHSEGGSATLIINADGSGEYAFSVLNIGDSDLNTETYSLTSESTAEDIIEYNYVQLTGNTVAEYAENVALMAAYLDQFGNTDYSLDRLLSAYALNADTTMLGKTLLSVTDIGSLQLTLDRAFMNGIVERNTKGIFGNGWVTGYEMTAERVQSDSTDGIIIDSPSGMIAFVKNDGVYQEVVYGLDTAVVDDLGAVTVTLRDGTVYTFDVDGNLSSVIDANNNAVILIRQDGRITALESSDGDRIDLEYTDGLVTKAVSKTDSVTYAYTDGYLTSVTGAYGTVRYAYDTESIGGKRRTLTSVTGLNGVTAHYEYDSLGRLTATYADDGLEKLSYIYGRTNEVTVLDAVGNKSVVSYDSEGNVVRTIGANGLVTNYAFDGLFRNTGISVYDERRCFYDYNEYGDLISAMDADGYSVNYNYDAHGNLTSITDKRGIVTEYLRDEKGNLTSIVYSDGSAEYYDYDSKGNIITLTDRMGNTTRYTYDGYSRQLKADYYNGSYIAYTYNENGNTTSIDENGSITAMTYDKNDNLLSISYPDGRRLSYTYDEYGQMLSVIDGDGSGSCYVYDRYGRTSAVTDEDGNILARYEYNADSSLYAVYNANGTYTRYTYADGLVKSIYNYGVDNSAQSFFVYTYDRFGNIEQIKTAEGVWKYEYDVIGQLTGVESPDGEKTAYTYDLSGNKTAVTVNGVTTDYESNRLNQTVRIGDMTLSYDLNGNLVRTVDSGTVTEYEYDVYGKLIRISVSGEQTAAYSYDAFGNRNSVTINGITTEYLNSPTGLGYAVAAFTNGKKTTYLWANGLVSSRTDADSYFYSFNHLGSVIDITDASGSVVNHYAYDVWGRLTDKNESITNPYRYVGQYGIIDDDNGLWYDRARYISQATETFITVDPLGQYADLNVYRYVVNNSVGFFDLSGCEELFPDGFKKFNLDGFDVFEKSPTNSGTTTSKYKFLDITKKQPDITTKQLKGDLLSCEKFKADQLRKASEESAKTLRITEKATGNTLKFTGKAMEQTAKITENTIANTAKKKAAEAMVRKTETTVGKAVGNATGKAVGAVVSKAVAKKIGTRLLLKIGLKFIPGIGWVSLALDIYDLAKLLALIIAGLIIRSNDPNDIIAPSGYGDAHWVSSTDALDYTIRFENDEEEATAPVNELVVTQKLDSDLDYRTFRLNAFGFGEYTFTVPENTAFYQTRLDMTDELGLYVDVSAGIDIVSGNVTYRFTAIDPQTGRIPDDPTVGFLPVNDENGAGEGFISYTIKPRSDVATGAEITAEASIVFDYNDAIDTPVVYNTVDAQAPVSLIMGVEAGDDGEVLITVNCTDDDDGSGVASYDLYVSVNGGAYQKVLSEQLSSVISYSVESGNRYCFYTIASDNAGNLEVPKPDNAVEYNAGYTPVAPQTPQINTSVLPNGAEYVTIDVQDGVTVIYTTNGEEPTLQNAEVYSGSVYLEPGTVIKARAISDGLYSEVVSDYTDIVLANGDVVLETETQKARGIEENSTAQTVINLFNGTDSSASIKDREQKPLSDTDLIGTGAVLTVDGKEYIIRIAGDINGDGKVDEDDYSLLRRHINGWNVDIELSAADVNGDGKINLKDLALIKQYINDWNVVII